MVGRHRVPAWVLLTGSELTLTAVEPGASGGIVDPVSSYTPGMESPAERWYCMATERCHDGAKRRLAELER